MESIKLKIGAHVKATAGAAFAVPYSVRLLTCMLKDLGPNAYALIDSGAWTQFIGDNQTCLCLDPVARHDRLLAGHLGTMYGIEIYTDAYYHPDEQSLPKDTLIVMAADGSRGYAVRLA
jgi:hypothetical protein